MRALGDGDDRQTSVERWRQIVGIGVVGQHVDGVVAVSSSTVALSSTASGASLMLLIVTLTVAVSVCPASAVPLSLMV